MKHYSDAQLADIENVTREAGYDLPIAWLIGFIQDYELLLPKELKKYPTMQAQLADIINWIKNGDPEGER